MTDRDGKLNIGPTKTKEESLSATGTDEIIQQQQQQQWDTSWIPLTGFYFLDSATAATKKKDTEEEETDNASPPLRPRLAISPYYYSFEVAAKGRWVGRPLLGVFLEEFQHHDEAYYGAAIDAGRMWVVRSRPLQQQEQQQSAARAGKEEESDVPSNVFGLEAKPMNGLAASFLPPRGQWWCGRRPIIIADKDALLGRRAASGCAESDGGGGAEWAVPPLTLAHGDTVHHVIHKHELTAFSDAPLAITDVSLLASHGLIAVDKPSSLPAHPSGRFFRVSLTEILSACFIVNVFEDDGDDDEGEGKKGAEQRGDVRRLPPFPRDAPTVEYLLRRFCFGAAAVGSVGCGGGTPLLFAAGPSALDAPLPPSPLLRAFPPLLASYEVLLGDSSMGGVGGNGGGYLRWGPTITKADKAVFHAYFSPFGQAITSEVERRRSSSLRRLNRAAYPAFNFAPCYRLDRATSGTILLSCTAASASWVSKALQAKTAGHTAGGTHTEAAAKACEWRRQKEEKIAKKQEQRRIAAASAAASAAPLPPADKPECIDGVALQQQQQPLSKKERKAEKRRQAVSDESGGGAVAKVEVASVTSHTNETVPTATVEAPQKAQEVTPSSEAEGSLGKSYLAKCKGDLRSLRDWLLLLLPCGISNSSGEHNATEEGGSGHAVSRGTPPPHRIADYVRQHCDVVDFDPSTGSISKSNGSYTEGFTNASGSIEASGVRRGAIRCAFPIYPVEASTFSAYPPEMEASIAAVATESADNNNATTAKEEGEMAAEEESGPSPSTAAVGLKRDREDAPSPSSATALSPAASASFRAQGRAKDALTILVPLFYSESEDATVVECFPLTGRTHQIRVHLGGMGCPIANDHKYLRHYGHWRDSAEGGNAAAAGDEAGSKTIVAEAAASVAAADAKEGISLAKVFYDPLRIPAALRCVLGEAVLAGGGWNDSGGEKDTRGAARVSVCPSTAAPPTALFDPLCDECAGRMAITAFGDEGSVIFLHAQKYTLAPAPLPNAPPLSPKVFTAPVPAWAQQ